MIINFKFETTTGIQLENYSVQLASGNTSQLINGKLFQFRQKNVTDSAWTETVPSQRSPKIPLSPLPPSLQMQCPVSQPEETGFF